MIIDINTRTNQYSKDISITPQELVRLSREKGLDGIVIVEKNRLWTDEEIQNLRTECDAKDFLILKGQEIKSPEGRLLVYGVNEEIADPTSFYETLKKIHTLGGCAVLTHPFSNNGKTANNPKDRMKYHDFIEIYNSTLAPGELRQGLENHRRYNFCALGGSEALVPENIGAFATKFLTPVNSMEDLVRAIKFKKARPCVIDGADVDPRGGSNEALLWKVSRSHLARCEGLLFDLYGTLINLKSFESLEEFTRMSRWLELEGIIVSGEALQEFYMRRAYELYRFAHEKIAFPDVDILRVFREALAHFSGVDRGEEFARRAALVFRALTIQSIKVYPYTRKILRELRRRGYRMGIVANGQAAFTIPEIEDLRLEDFFDFVLLSSDVGYSKPEHKIFQIATTQMEIEPSKIAMIGDDLHGDIFAAKIAGLRTVFIKSDVTTDPFPVDPDVSITNGDLRNLLRVFP